MDNPDAQIIESLKKGDHKALENLFQQFFEPLVKYTSRVTNNREASREIVQELFIWIWQNRIDLHIRTSLKTYLYSSSYHRALNWIRHNKVEEKFREQGVIGFIEASAQPSEIQPFLKQRIELAIDRLPDRMKTVFTCTQLLDLSHKETALKLGIATKTVENLLSRAKKQLRKELKNYFTP